MYNALIFSHIKIPFAINQFVIQRLLCPFCSFIFYDKGHKGKHKVRKVLNN